MRFQVRFELHFSSSRVFELESSSRARVFEFDLSSAELELDTYIQHLNRYDIWKGIGFESIEDNLLYYN